MVPSQELLAYPGGTLHTIQGWLGVAQHPPATLPPRGVPGYKSSLDPGLRARFAPDSARLRELTGLEVPWVSAT